jgi:hypothetical protein
VLAFKKKIKRRQCVCLELPSFRPVDWLSLNPKIGHDGKPSKRRLRQMALGKHFGTASGSKILNYGFF